MVPEDVVAWIHSQLGNLAYVHPSECTAEVVRVLNEFERLRPQAKAVNNCVQLVLYDGPLEICVPPNYPAPVAVYFQGRFTGTEPSIRSAAQSMHQQVTAQTPIPPPIPAKYVTDQTPIRPPLPPKLLSKVPDGPSHPISNLPSHSTQNVMHPTQNVMHPMHSIHPPPVPQSPIRAPAQSVPASPYYAEPHVPAPPPAPTPVPVPVKAVEPVKTDLMNMESSSVKTVGELFTPVQLPPTSLANDKLLLESYNSTLQSYENQLQTAKQTHQANIRALTTALSAASQALQNAPFDPSIDELVRVEENDRERAEVADQAIDRLLTLLPRALDAGALSFELYLRLVRQYTREQFGYRAVTVPPFPASRSA